MLFCDAELERAFSLRGDGGLLELGRPSLNRLGRGCHASKGSVPHGSVPYKPKLSIKGRKVHPQNLDFSSFPNSLRCPRERRDRGPVKKSCYQRILSSIGRNLRRFVKTRINDENECLKILKILTFSVPRPPPTRRGRLKQAIRRPRRRLWGSAGNSFF